MNMKVHSEATRKMHVRNFGLGQRDMSRALSNAYQLAGNGFAANATAKTAIREFTEHVKTQYQIKDLRRVEKSHVMSFAQSLSTRFHQGTLSASSAQNYLSTVNVAMQCARRDSHCRVEGVREAAMPTRTGIATRDHSASQEMHQRALQCVPERLAIQLELQRELGLRFKESCLLNAKQALCQAHTQGKMTVDAGTKGGREREIPLHSARQMAVLTRAAQIQGEHRSLVPKHMSWAQYQRQAYQAIRTAPLHFHQERHHFANAMYARLTGCPSPVQSGIAHKQHIDHLAKTLNVSKAHAKTLDTHARRAIAHALGHGRSSITNAYLG